MAITCPKCHSDNPDTKRFCGECGTQLLPAEKIPSPTKTLETPVEQLTTGAPLLAGTRLLMNLEREEGRKYIRSNGEKLVFYSAFISKRSGLAPIFCVGSHIVYDVYISECKEVKI